ncbi:MAG: DNA-3-methyladenine glycosylase I [Hyphomicrobiaceae bacterium]|nr:DNA-3-methyladenine glycosylase I [Hyphomicrobiaceae bacterium]
MTNSDNSAPCPWATSDPLYVGYHAHEWGRPVTSDVRLYEKLCLEGFQSGLSWITILRKRENFRRAFAGFDFHQVARFGEADVARLLQDEGIIRHQGKIRATIANAAAVLDVVSEFGSFAAYIWRFEPAPAERPGDYSWETLRTVTTCDSAARLSKDLKKRGFKFVGPTTCYAFMQAMGMVNDHIDTCPCRVEAEAERSVLKRPT